MAFGRDLFAALATRFILVPIMSILFLRMMPIEPMIDGDPAPASLERLSKPCRAMRILRAVSEPIDLGDEMPTDGAGETGASVWRPGLVPPAGALAQKPEGVPDDLFAAALFKAGTLRPREIHVSRLDIPKHAQYNKEIVENCF